jgi:DNA-binding MarR family transcriptional regulator
MTTGESLFEYAARAPHSNASTSHEAAKSVEKDVTRIAKRVLDAIKHEPRACFEIEEDLDLSHQTASARITQLRKDGLIEDSGDRRPTASNRRAIVWRAK